MLHNEDVHARESALLTVSLLSIVSDITQSIGAVRIKPHQARQQRLGSPHTHACQSTWTSHCLVNAACQATRLKPFVVTMVYSVGEQVVESTSHQSTGQAGR